MNEQAADESTHIRAFAGASGCVGLGVLVASIVKLTGGKELTSGELSLLYITLLATVCCVCLCFSWACNEPDGTFSGCCPVLLLGILGLTGVITNMPHAVALSAVLLTAGCLLLGCLAMCCAAVCGTYLSRTQTSKGKSRTFLVRPDYSSHRFEGMPSETSDDSIV